MKLPALLALLVLSVCPTCASLPTGDLPPLPTSAPTELGPIPITRVKDLKCLEPPVDALGCFHAHPYRIEIREPMRLDSAWAVLYHEMFHVHTYASGHWFRDGAVADSLADMVAKGRMVELRSHWPR